MGRSSPIGSRPSSTGPAVYRPYARRGCYLRVDPKPDVRSPREYLHDARRWRGPSRLTPCRVARNAVIPSTPLRRALSVEYMAHHEALTSISCSSDGCRFATTSLILILDAMPSHRVHQRSPRIHEAGDHVLTSVGFDCAPTRLGQAHPKKLKSSNSELLFSVLNVPGSLRRLRPSSKDQRAGSRRTLNDRNQSSGGVPSSAYRRGDDEAVDLVELEAVGEADGFAADV